MILARPPASIGPADVYSIQGCPRLAYARVRLSLRLFVVDFSARQFIRDGERIHLQEQPFQLLVTLLERPDQVVMREELRTKLWPANVIVDFDHRLSNAITRLREVLGDDADSPRFIETVPRVGYRFIYPLAAEPGSGVPAEQSSNGPAGPDPLLPAQPQASTPNARVAKPNTNTAER